MPRQSNAIQVITPPDSLSGKWYVGRDHAERTERLDCLAHSRTTREAFPIRAFSAGAPACVCRRWRADRGEVRAFVIDERPIAPRSVVEVRDLPIRQCSRVAPFNKSQLWVNAGRGIGNVADESLTFPADWHVLSTRFRGAVKKRGWIVQQPRGHSQFDGPGWRERVYRWKVAGSAVWYSG